MRYGDDDTIRHLLTDTGVWAVVGLSNDTGRTAYSIAQYLRRGGKRVVPVHPSAPTVAGEQGFATLSDIPFPVDVVDVFVRSELAGPVVDEAVKIRAKGVWLQLGVRDDAAALRAGEAGLAVVMDTCPAMEAPRLGLAWTR
jgi:predicted CoA-binding protein